MISIPIIVRNTKIGAFNLYSQETNFFSSEEEISLLEKIILNIAFALESILVEEDRKLTEEKIRQLSQAVEQSPVTIVISNTDGDIEIGQSALVFGADEFENIRMVATQYAHLRTTARTGGFYRRAGSVKHLHERNRAGGA